MPFIVVIAGILIIVTALGYSVVSSNREIGSPVATTEVSVVPRDRRDDMNMMMGEMGDVMTYQDGTYTALVPYAIPYGYIEPMEVSLTIVGGNVTETSVVFDLVNPTSLDYQRWFLGYYKKEVIGKAIDSVSLARVGGASLSNMAFDQAVATIKEDANPMGSVSMMRQSSKYDESTVFSNGEYVIDDYYVVNPFLSESMQTLIAVKDGIIVDSQVFFLKPDPISAIHQNFFMEQYKDAIIGKPLYSASMARVGSASLTTDTFNSALEKVRVQAQS